MRFTHPLDKIFGQLSKVRILRHLTLYSDWQTGREIARAVKISHPVAHSAMASLKEEGVVIMKKSGSAYLYRINQDDLLVKHSIRPLFFRENTLPSKILCDYFLKYLPKSIASTADSFILYGSTAKETEKPYSDIDVLVVAPSVFAKKEAEEGLLKVAPEIAKSYSRQISPLIITRKDFISKIKKKDPLMNQILHDGRLLYGKSISELIKADQNKS